MNIDKIINVILRTKFGMFGFCATIFLSLIFCTGCFPFDVLGCLCRPMCDENNLFEDCSDEIDKTFGCTGFFSDDGCEETCTNGIVYCGGLNESLCTECNFGCSGGCETYTCQFVNCIYERVNMLKYEITIKDKFGSYLVDEYFVREFTNIQEGETIELSTLSPKLQYFNIDSVNLVSVPNGYKISKCEVYKSGNRCIVKDSKGNTIEKGTIELEIIVTESRYGEPVNLNYYVDDKCVSSSVVKVGVQSENLYSPIKTGYRFVGWFTKDGKPFDFTDNIFHYYNNQDSINSSSNQIDLYAQFENEVYDVNVNINGVSKIFKFPYKSALSTNKDFVNYVNNVVIPEKKHFDSWSYNDNNYSTEEILDKVVYKNINITAVYKNIYTLDIYNIKGLDHSETSIEVIESENIDLNQFKVSEYYEKWRFSGFYSDSSFTNSELDVICVTSDMSIYLKWEELSQFTIKYYDGDYQIAIETYLINEGKELRTHEAPLGYKFVGWCENKDLSDTPIMSLDSSEYGNKIFYAKYSPKEYEIKLYSAGGTVGEYVSTLTFNEEFILPVPTKEGFVFAGWYINNSEKITDENGKSLNVFVEQYQSIAEGVYQAFAKWDIQTLKVDFVYNDGEEEIVYDSQVVNYGETVRVVSTSPYKQGYDFAGWYNSDGTSFDKTKAIYKDTIVTAKFVAKKYTITLNASGGNIDGANQVDVTIDYDGKISLSVPTRDGFIFIGWEDSSGRLYTGADGKMLFNYTLTEDIILYAKWI